MSSVRAGAGGFSTSVVVQTVLAVPEKAMRAQLVMSTGSPAGIMSTVTSKRTRKVAPMAIAPSETPSGSGSSSGNSVPLPSSGMATQPPPTSFSVELRT